MRVGYETMPTWSTTTRFVAASLFRSGVDGGFAGSEKLPWRCWNQAAPTR